MKHSAPVTRAIIYGNIGVAVLDVLLTLRSPESDSAIRQILSLSAANTFAISASALSASGSQGDSR